MTLSIITECGYAEYHKLALNAECYFAQCQYAQCHYGEFHYAKCHYTECPVATVEKSQHISLVIWKPFTP